MTSTVSSTTTLLALRRAPSQAIATLLALLDRPHLDGAILLVGKSVDKAALAREFAQRSARAALRTPQGRFVLSAALDASALPASLRPWQHLIYVVLDIVRRRSGPNATLDALRQQFDNVLRLEQRNDATADFALAAFVHHFRTHFGTLLEELPESVLALVIYHLDKADPEDAKELIEAAQYFLNTPRCAIVCPVDEDQLTPALRHQLLQWATARLSLEEEDEPAATPTASAAQPSMQEAQQPLSSLRDLPESCARVLLDALQPDAEAIARAAARWRIAMRALSAQAAAGEASSVSAVHVARLCALRELLPAVFDAVLQQPALLHRIERAVRAANATTDADAWTRAVRNHPRAKALFAPPPAATFAMLGETALRTALHAIAGTSNHAPATAQPSAVRASSSPTARPAKPTWLLALNDIAALLVPAVLIFVLDRAVKAVALSGNMGLGGVLSAPAWAPPDIGLNVLSLTLVLLGLALGVLLVLVFGAHRRNALARFAYALLLGGLSALLADHLLFGAPLNVVHLPELPRFSPAHALAAFGAALLAASALIGEQPQLDRR